MPLSIIFSVPKKTKINVAIVPRTKQAPAQVQHDAHINNQNQCFHALPTLLLLFNHSEFSG